MPEGSSGDWNVPSPSLFWGNEKLIWAWPQAWLLRFQEALSLAPCPVHGEGGRALVKSGLYQVSKRGYQAPGLGGCSRSLEHFLTGAAFWFWQRPGLHGDKEIGKENDSSWLRAQKMYVNAFMQTKIRLWRDWVQKMPNLKWYLSSLH